MEQENLCHGHPEYNAGFLPTEAGTVTGDGSQTGGETGDGADIIDVGEGVHARDDAGRLGRRRTGAGPSKSSRLIHENFDIPISVDTYIRAGWPAAVRPAPPWSP